MPSTSINGCLHMDAIKYIKPVYQCFTRTAEFEPVVPESGVAVVFWRLCLSSSSHSFLIGFRYGDLNGQRTGTVCPCRTLRDRWGVCGLAFWFLQYWPGIMYYSLYDFTNLPLNHRSTLNVNQCCTTWIDYYCPYHNTTSSKPVTLLDTILRKTFVLASIHSKSSIGTLQ